jgi:hypothetical protein
LIQDLGITGVPFFVFGNKYAISGAQPPESFFEVFQEIAKGEVLQCSECPCPSSSAAATAAEAKKTSEQPGEGSDAGVICTVAAEEENICGFQKAAREQEEQHRRGPEVTV